MEVDEVIKPSDDHIKENEDYLRISTEINNYIINYENIEWLIQHSLKINSDGFLREINNNQDLFNNLLGTGIIEVDYDYRNSLIGDYIFYSKSEICKNF